ncbi:MAG: hypothetical protein GY822_14425 [Deltaproteobacteria bacterium]|nr:hypothetical protein [Deltaproteobacteria bacterium]
MEISIFKNVWENRDGGQTSIPEFINNIRFGEWKDQTIKINQESDKAKRTELKKSLPYVTISGLFTHRKKDGLVKHSGFMCMDFDDVDDVNEAFKIVCNDPHTAHAFKSVSGRGLAVLVKINPKRHLDAFQGLERYYANKYQLVIDKSCKDITRPRFVSYDPNTFSNSDAIKFEHYIPKSERNVKLPRVVTGENDMDFIMDQINENCVDLTGGEYHRWLELGFAIAEKYGESGRTYYHAVSQFSSKYDTKVCDKQYNHCTGNNGNGVTFATFLFHAKNAGLAIVSPETKHIAAVAMMGKKAGRGLNEVINTIKSVDTDINPETVETISEEIFKRNDIGKEMELEKIPGLELFVSSNYDLRRNEVTQFIECNGDEIDTIFTNSMWIKSRKEYDDKVTKDELNALIHSDFTPNYNPIHEFFERNTHVSASGNIRRLADSIKSPTGAGNDFVFTMLKKWMVGIVASAYGKHSPLLLVLVGGQNTGKTEFFRRLLPEPLRRFYAESKLDREKDDEILMTQKLMILDDEFGGKTKRDSKRLKELTSKQQFTLREPYGKKNVTLNRLAVLCGTSNDEQLLNDSTGNRRIIPIEISSIDHQQYNAIDKMELMIECYMEFKAGFNYELDRDDISLLNQSTKKFEQVVPERELLMKYFKHPEYANNAGGVEYMQGMEIKAYLERITQQRLIITKVITELRNLNFMQTGRVIDGHERQVFSVVKRNEQEIETSNFEGIEPLGGTPF